MPAANKRFNLSQASLVAQLVSSGVIRSSRVKSVMEMVDRKFFVNMDFMSPFTSPYQVCN